MLRASKPGEPVSTQVRAFFGVVLSFTAASFGRTARRKRWRNWVTVHIAGMGSSYVILIIAFYVDNGKNLPLWKDLPHALYWLLPSAAGIPLIIWAMLRHPPARHH